MMNDSYIIDELLLQGADVDKVSFDGKSVLHYAVLESQLSTVLKLIPKVNDINHKDKQGNTALHFAVLSCSLDIVTALVNSGADVSATNNNGRTPAALMPNVLKQTSEIYECLQTKK
jgi:ankyrin repeat protein